MSDTEDDGFTEEVFKGFGENPAPVTPPAADPIAPPVDPPKADPKPAEEPKEDEKPAETPEKTPPATADDKKEEDAPKPPETPETPAAPETPQPLTKDDVKSVVSDLLNNERSSGKELETATKDVMDAYYPQGLSNVLVDEKSGKELRDTS
jgi:outer membrane biosynthesis protein TonB